MPSIDLRPATPADIETVHTLVRTAEVHDRIPEVTPHEEIVELFDQPNVEPEKDIRLAVVSGEVVGYATMWYRPSEEHQEQAILSGTVHPDFRGRGVGRRLFAWQIDRGTQALRTPGRALPCYLRTFTWDWLTDAQRLYERFGFIPVRWFDELLRPLNPPLEIPHAAGVDIVPWETVSSEDVREVHNASFADHWGPSVVGADAWSSRLKRYGVRLDLSFGAVAGDRVVGYTLNEVFPEDEALLGRRDGWIGGLGVLREFRGQGIASALIATSLAAFQRAGLTHASIGVDADNPTGAHRLYRRLGFLPEKRSVAHELEV